MITLRDSLQSVLGQKQDILLSAPAMLGNGEGVTDVPNRPGYSYVRQGSEVFEVRNSRVLTRMDGLPILIGVTAEQPDLTQVLTVNHGAAALLSTMLDYLSAHAPTHRLFATNGGSDVVWIEGLSDHAGEIGDGFEQRERDRLPIHGLLNRYRIAEIGR